MSREYYDRIIDLSRKVVEGAIDPLDVDISTLLDFIRQVDIEGVDLDLLKRDVEAVKGLAVILSIQKERIRNSIEGFRLDQLLVKTALLALNLEELYSIVRSVYRPPVEVYEMDPSLLGDALTYFRSIRRFELDVGGGREAWVEGDPLIEADVRDEMFRLHRDLLAKYGGDWIEYASVVDGDVYKAYIISLLASEGYVDIYVDRVGERVFIRVLRERRRFINPVSIPLVVRDGG